MGNEMHAKRDEIYAIAKRRKAENFGLSVHACQTILFCQRCRGRSDTAKPNEREFDNTVTGL